MAIFIVEILNNLKLFFQTSKELCFFKSFSEKFFSQKVFVTVEKLLARKKFSGLF